MVQVDIEEATSIAMGLLQDEDENQSLKKSDDARTVESLYPKRPGFLGYLRTSVCLRASDLWPAKMSSLRVPGRCVSRGPMCHNTLFALFFLNLRGDPADKSVCGYNQTNPFWVNVFFGMLCWSGAELTFRMMWGLARRGTPRELPIFDDWDYRPYLEPFLRLLGCGVAMCLCGFVVIPRCIFEAHQTFVLFFMYGGAVIMLLVALLYPDIDRYAMVGYWTSCYVCYLYYWEGGYEFFYGEAGFIFFYTQFMTVALQVRLDRSFKVLQWLMVTAPMGWFMIVVQREVLIICKNPHEMADVADITHAYRVPGGHDY